MSDPEQPKDIEQTTTGKSKSFALAMIIGSCILLVGLVAGFLLCFEVERISTNKVETPASNNIFHEQTSHNALSQEEQNRIDKAKQKCESLNCCREDDNEETDSRNCRKYGYLDCLSADNACIWDCANNGHYKHRFMGIHREDANYREPKASKEEEDPTTNEEKPQILADTIDFCGTVYQLDLPDDEKEKLRQKLEDESNIVSLQTNAQNVEEAEGAEVGAEFERRLGVIGTDGRTPVTSWGSPYYKNVLIFFDTASGPRRCSGSFITGKHILTAGHCVSDGNGNFYSNWDIYPSYGAGSSEKFDHYQAWVFNDWHVNSDWNYDIGIITLQTDNAGYGWYALGWNDNIASSWLFETTGYPGDTGYTMQAQTSYMDHSITYNLLKTQTGDVVGGNSGGPTCLDSSKYIYGVVSHETYIDHGTWKEYVYNGYARITKEKYAAMCTYIESFSTYANHCYTD